MVEDSSNQASGHAGDSARSASDADRLQDARPASPGDPATQRSHEAEADRPVSSGSDGQPTVISKRAPASLPTFRQAATPFEMGRVLEGEQLGPFQLEEFVGGGGMGAVFRATDTMLGRTVAVKVVSQHQTDPETLRRFRNEAQSAARLDHPHIARVYYVGEDKGWHYIVFEYIEGINVRDLVSQIGPLSLRDAMSYALQIADALEHASRREVIHRDIKPSNILIMADGRAKLVDMGLARLHQVESNAEDLTASGVTLGTFDYISPEQASDPRNTDVRSDLYSLGCTLYFMLTGQPPFPDGTMLQKLLKHSSVEPPDPRRLRPELPDGLVAVVRRLLAKVPKDRYQTPHELIADLLVEADALDLSDIQPAGGLWTTPRPPRSTWWERCVPWAVPVVVLLIAALALQLFSVARSPVVIPPPRLASEPAAASRSVPDQPPVEEPGGGTVPDAGDPPPMTPPSTREPSAESAQSSRDETSPEDAATAEPPNSEQPEPEPDDPAAAGASRAKTATSPEDEADAPETAPSSDVTDGPVAKTSGSGTEPPDAGESTEANGSVASAGDDPLAPAPPIEPLPLRLIVGPEPGADLEGGLPVDSLREAFERAMTTDRPVEVELWFDGPRSMEPMTLDLRGSGDRNLVIRAGEGYQPLLQFQPAAEETAGSPRRVMLNVLGGRVSWADVQFHLSVPPAEADAAATWALCRMNDVERMEFRRCVLTVRRRTPEAVRSGDRAYFFVLAAPSARVSEGEGLPPVMTSTPTIWMEHCIARGQATLLHAERAIPFLLFWDQGALISSERVLEMGGTPVEPHWEYGRATLFLQRLLAAVDQGISLLKADASAPYQLGLAANCYDCLFVTASTDPPTPLYELRSASILQDDAVLLDVGGNNNYYKNTKVVLRVQTVGAPGGSQEYAFDELTARNGQPWYNEKGAQPATMFNWSEPARPADEQTLDDFMPGNGTDGALKRILNITPSQLPQPLPVARPQPALPGEMLPVAPFVP